MSELNNNAVDSIATDTTSPAAQSPRVGDMVHFVATGGEHLAAVVVRIAENDTLDLSVCRGNYFTRVAGAARDEPGRKPQTWHLVDDTTSSPV